MPDIFKHGNDSPRYIFEHGNDSSRYIFATFRKLDDASPTWPASHMNGASLGTITITNIAIPISFKMLHVDCGNIRHSYKVNLLLWLFYLLPLPYHYHHHYHHLWHYHQHSNQIFTTRWTSCTPAGGSQCGSGVQTRGSQCFRSGWCLVKMIMMRMTLIRCRLEKYDKDDDDLLTGASQCFRSGWCLVMIMMRMSRMMRMRYGHWTRW